MYLKENRQKNERALSLSKPYDLYNFSPFLVIDDNIHIKASTNDNKI